MANPGDNIKAGQIIKRIKLIFIGFAACLVTGGVLGLVYYFETNNHHSDKRTIVGYHVNDGLDDGAAFAIDKKLYSLDLDMFEYFKVDMPEFLSPGESGQVVMSYSSLHHSYVYSKANVDIYQSLPLVSNPDAQLSSLDFKIGGNEKQVVSMQEQSRTAWLISSSELGDRKSFTISLSGDMVIDKKKVHVTQIKTYYLHVIPTLQSLFWILATNIWIYVVGLGSVLTPWVWKLLFKRNKEFDGSQNVDEDLLNALKTSSRNK